MSRKKSTYTEAFRRETVRLPESSGKSVLELAQELGVHPKSLYCWRAKYGTASRLTEAEPGQVSELEAELSSYEVRMRCCGRSGISKNSCQHLHPEPAMSYAIIEAHRDQGGVETMCRALGVSVSGYYSTD